MIHAKSILTVFPFVFYLLLGMAQANPHEWDNTTPEELGITNSEFDMVKKHGMSKSRLLQLLEIGILPSEYFSEPWKKLGVTESHWIAEKEAGMSDEDIDQSYRRQESGNFDPVITFFLPGFYQYKTSQTWHGAALTATFLAGGALTFLHTDKTGSVYPTYPIAAFVAMIWSAGDAYMGTRFTDNPEAGRFSWNLGLMEAEGVAAAFRMKF